MVTRWFNVVSSRQQTAKSLPTALPITAEFTSFPRSPALARLTGIRTHAERSSGLPGAQPVRTSPERRWRAFVFRSMTYCRRLSADSGEPVSQLRIDGGAAANNLLVQFQADISAIEVVRPANLETTALGAAYLAGIAAGLWTIGELNQKWRIDRSFHGTMPAARN